jgi:hypothetical protein
MSRQQPEAQIQRAVIQHLRLRPATGVFAFHVPNGGARRPIEAAILKDLGVVAGTPDLIIIRGGRAHCLELKSPGRHLTATQKTVHQVLRAAGASGRWRTTSMRRFANSKSGNCCEARCHEPPPS